MSERFFNFLDTRNLIGTTKNLYIIYVPGKK